MNAEYRNSEPESLRNSGARCSTALLNGHSPQPDTQNVEVIQELGGVVRELRCLLDDYAPVWYTESQSERTEAALRLLEQLHV